MLHTKHRWVLISILACHFSSFGLAPADPTIQTPVSAQSDDTALRALVNDLYATYPKKDLSGYLLLWSEKSLDRVARERDMKKFFADHGQIEVKGLTIRPISMEAEKAKLRVEIEIDFVETKTDKAAGLRKMKRAVYCVKEAGRWKIWREMPAEEDLAEVLAAHTEAERGALLETEKDLVTVELVRGLLRQGIRLSEQRKYLQATALYLLAQKLADEINDKSGVRNSLYYIGNIHYFQSQYPQALDYYQKSLALSRASDDKGLIARSTSNIGVIHRIQGNYPQALKYLQECLAISKDLDDKNGIAISLGNIGNTYLDLGDFQRAMDSYQEELEIRKTQNNQRGIASALGGIGAIHRYQGNYAQALDYYKQSLAMSESLNYIPSTIVMLNSIGTIYQIQGNYSQSLDYFQKGLAMSEATDYKAGIAFYWDNVGTLYTSQGNYAKALEYHQKSIAIKEALGDKGGIARSLLNIGTIYGLQGDNEQAQVNYAKALESHRKSLAIFEAIGDKHGIAISLGSIGDVYRAQGNYAEALDNCKKSLEINETLGAKEGLGITLGVIGSIYKAQGRFREALQFAERAVDASKQTGNSDSLWRDLLTAGVAHRALNQLAQARQAFADSIDTIEKVRAQLAGGERDAQQFLENKVSPYLAMVDLLVEQNNFAEALVYAERAKARVLLDALYSGRINITKAMTDQEQEQERKLTNQFASLNTQIYREKILQHPDKARLDELSEQLRKARLEYEAFETKLYAAHPKLKAQRGQAPTLTLEEIGSLLPDAKTAALQFVVSKEKSSLFVLTKNAPGSPLAVEVKVFPIAITKKDLTARVMQLRNQIAERDQTFARNAKAMFQLLLGAAQPSLQGKTTLIVVPDGALWELPFQALLSPGDRYLQQDYTVFYTPSLTALGEMVKLRQNRPPVVAPTLLALGNPALGEQIVKRAQNVQMDEKLNPLIGAQRQVEKLREIYGPQQSKIYLGPEATEDRVKAESANYRVLHLAAHGFLDNRNPMYSNIVLSQMNETGKEDGLLEAWEIMRLELKADLAVLSACMTARGRVVSGEGVIGLAWAFFVAGCPTTVVSQWNVNDESTAELMIEFHRRLESHAASLKSRNSIAEALRQASLKLLKNPLTRHPYYWAGFIVMGDGF